MKGFQSSLTSSRWIIPAVSLLCLGAWLVSGVLLARESHTNLEGLPTWWTALMEYIPSTYASQALDFVLMALLGYGLLVLNNRFPIIRLRASVQTTFFLLLVAICPKLHHFDADSLVACCWFLALYFLFDTYQRPQQADRLFHAFFFLSVGSLLSPPLAWFSICWLWEAHRLRGFSLRNFCGALVGGILPIWLLWAHAWYHNDLNLFYEPLHRLTDFAPWGGWGAEESWLWATVALLFLWWLTAAGHALVAGFEDKIQTRTYVQTLVHLSFWILVLMALQPMHMRMLLLPLMINVSFLIGHFFSLTRSRASNAFAIASCIGLLLLFSYNLWML